MKTSKGRDKFCNLIQVYAEFYLTCLKNTNIEDLKIEKNHDLLTNKRIAKSIIFQMSSGRKIFKFLKFTEYITKIIALS